MSDKEAAKVLIAHRIRFMDDFGWDKTTLEALDIAIASLATESKLVVKGEWNEIERGGLFIKYALFRCTHCGNIFKVYEDTLNAGRGDKNFCPNCGADMRKETNDGEI